MQFNSLSKFLRKENNGNASSQALIKRSSPQKSTKFSIKNHTIHGPPISFKKIASHEERKICQPEKQKGKVPSFLLSQKMVRSSRGNKPNNGAIDSEITTQILNTEASSSIRGDIEISQATHLRKKSDLKSPKQSLNGKPYRNTDLTHSNRLATNIVKNLSKNAQGQPKQCPPYQKDSFRRVKTYFSSNQLKYPAFLPNRKQQKFTSMLSAEVLAKPTYSMIFEDQPENLRSSPSEHTLASKRDIDEDRNSPLREEKRPRKWLISDFIRIKALGKGRYGDVILAMQKVSGFICAIKQLSKALLNEDDLVDQLIREIKIQKHLNHPNIVKMYGCFSDQENIYILLEPVLGGQLLLYLQKRKTLSEAKTVYFMRQICDAVKEIHTRKILHRDIKPENVVIHQNIVKLCDFGWSVYHGNQLRTTFCGTPLYISPEILVGKQYNQKVDIWSLGIMTYEMLIGQNPFHITTQQEMAKIVKEEINIPSRLMLSKQAKMLLEKTLSKRPSERPDILEVCSSQFFARHPESKMDRNYFTFI